MNIDHLSLREHEVRVFPAMPSISEAVQFLHQTRNQRVSYPNIQQIENKGTSYTASHNPKHVLGFDIKTRIIFKNSKNIVSHPLLPATLYNNE